MTPLQRAGADAGLPDDEATQLSYHDFSHAGLMDLGSRVTDVNALAFLAGHKSVTTTAQYVRGREAGARRALEVCGDTRDTAAAKVVPIKRSKCSR